MSALFLILCAALYFSKKQKGIGDVELERRRRLFEEASSEPYIIELERRFNETQNAYNSMRNSMEMRAAHSWRYALNRNMQQSTDYSRMIQLQKEYDRAKQVYYQALQDYYNTHE